MKNIRAKTPKNRIFFMLLSAVCVLAMLFGTALIIGAAENADVEYIYFDLAAGNVTINGSSYTGYAYQKTGEDSFTKVEISGTIGANEAYYIYQSEGGASAPDGYFVISDEEKIFTLPQREPVKVGDKQWEDYVTNNADVEAVISAWKTSAEAAHRTATGKRVSVKGQVSATIVIDNLWSSFHEYGTSKVTGGFSFYPSSSNSKLTVQLKGA